MNDTAELQEDTAASGPKDLGDKIAELDELRDRKRELNAEFKDIEERYKALEAEIIEDLDTQGVEMTKTGRATVSISTQAYPTVTDWDQVFEYIKANDALYLFQRRLASGPCNEMWEADDEIPGVEKFEKRSLNLRKNR